jgi:hypothetical protein
LITITVRFYGASMASTTTAAAPAPLVAVRLLAWGGTDADIECAVRDAGRGWSRETWQITVERVPGPVNVRDGTEIATRRTKRWGWVAMPGYVHA